MYNLFRNLRSQSLSLLSLICVSFFQNEPVNISLVNLHDNFERQKQLIDNFVHKFREFQTTCTINIGP